MLFLSPIIGGPELVVPCMVVYNLSRVEPYLTYFHKLGKYHTFLESLEEPSTSQ